MTAAQIRHRAISASAGSGKTFQLAHRYIELMARGVEPDRIIALTFSRKAAGEIFDSVVRYLCQAASSPEAASRTAELIQKPDTSQRDFLQILRGLLESLHRLHIGTLDSFTVGVAKTFPLELGIPPRFQLLGEEGAAGGARRQVLDRVFTQRGSNQSARVDFLRANKQATFGREERKLIDRLEALVKEKRGYYQVLPNPDAWGSVGSIWGQSPPWWQDAGDVEAAAGRLLELLNEDGLSDGVLERWRTFADAVRRFGTGSSWPRALEYLFGKLCERNNVESLRAGALSFKIDRVPQHLSPEECRHALVLMAHVVQSEMIVALERTRGIYRVLDQYEASYDEILRQHGRLTFTDVQYLLTAGNRASRSAIISRQASAEARLYIDYRLDCKLDHWLLDEFQDTSDLQWEVLSNLADEILQDSGGRRSFFYVGDTKQAIYGWRGGNARLFSRILDHYGERIELSHLSTSYRSCQAVIDAVNQAFGSIPPGLLPEGAVKQWERSWQMHQCEEGEVPANGCVALLEPSHEEGNEKPGKEDRYRIVARLLQDTDPLRKGLSVGVLVRSNKSGEEVVDYLRRECGGMRIIHEGLGPITDNPVVAVLRSLVQFAAHPGDMLAWRHLQMSPLREYLAREGMDRDTLPLRLLRQIQSGGFRSLIGEWGARLEAAGALDDFGRQRLAQLTDAAIEFDRTGNRDVNSFLRVISSYEVHDLAASEAVRVMTVHQSKGLGFDIVILPDLQEGNLTQARRLEVLLARDPVLGHPLWALQMPPRRVAEIDDVLKEQVQAADETSAFDDLCLLYVAMTRAKQGLYIITSFQGKTAQVITPAAFLKRQLAGDLKRVEGQPFRIAGEDAVCLYQAGDLRWHAQEPEKDRPPAAAVAARLPPDFNERSSRRRRLVRVLPSQRPETSLKASLLFAPDARDSRDVGTAVHRLFEKVTWIDEVDVEGLVAEWSASCSLREDLKQRAETLFRRAMAAPEVRHALARPSGGVHLWREKRFEVVIGNRWVSGALDRVMVFQNQKGRPVEAAVFDFKSDDVSDEATLTELARQYRPQMEAYQKAVSTMLGVTQARVALAMVFVQPGKVLNLK